MLTLHRTNHTPAAPLPPLSAHQIKVLTNSHASCERNDGIQDSTAHLAAIFTTARTRLAVADAYDAAHHTP